MRNSHRRNKATLILAAAAGVVVTTHMAMAAPTDDTWSAAAGSGNWTDTTKWLGGAAPTAGTTTILTFPATGVQTYTATNNIGAFTLGTLNLPNSGTGVVTVAGSALQTDGVVPVTGGTGPSVISAPLNSISAPSGSTGGVFNFVGGNVTLSGGGNLLAMTTQGGNLTITGGAYTLTSTLRRNDSLTGQNTGPWSLTVGETDGSTANITQTGGTITARQGFINSGFGTTGTWAISGPGTVANFSFGNPDGAGGRFGQLTGNGSINVSAGAVLSGRLFEVGRTSFDNGGNNIGPITARVNVSGANSQINAHQLVNRAEGPATITVSTGGLINLTHVDATGSTGAGLMVLGGATQGTLADPVPSTAWMHITGPVSQVRAIQPQIGDELGAATVNITGGGSYVANPSPAPATIGEASFLGSADALDGSGNNNTSGFGAILVDGAGSIYNQTTTAGGVIVMGGGGGSTQGGDALIRVSAGGEVRSNDLTVGQDEGSDAVLEVNGATSSVNVIPNGSGSLGAIVVAGNRAGPLFATGIINQNGGTISTGLLFLGGGFADTLGDPVPGGNGTMTMAAGTRFTVADQFTMASVPQGNGTLTNNGGTIAVGGSGFMATETGSTARVTINGGTWTVARQMQIGGSGGTLGGTAVVTLNNGTMVVGTGSGTDLLAVYQTSTLTVGSSLRVNGETGVDGWIQYDSGTFNTTGTLSVAGRVQLSTAGRGVNGTPTNKKTLEAGSLEFTTSGIIDLNDNDALIHSNTLAEVETFVRTGRNGGLWTGTMLTSTAAKNNGLKHTGLGAIRGSEYKAGNGGTTSFNGRALVNSDVVVKYTFNGDTELNGTVNGADYARVDTTFNNEISQGNIGGWFNGDFDYNGKVDGADYALIDAAFNQQGVVVLSRPGEGTLAGPESVVFEGTGMERAIAGQKTAGEMARRLDLAPDGSIAPGQVVPEPSMLGLAGVAMLGAMSRRRRSR